MTVMFVTTFSNGTGHSLYLAEKQPECYNIPFVFLGDRGCMYGWHYGTHIWELRASPRAGNLCQWIKQLPRETLTSHFYQKS